MLHRAAMLALKRNTRKTKTLQSLKTLAHLPLGYRIGTPNV